TALAVKLQRFLVSEGRSLAAAITFRRHLNPLATRSPDDRRLQASGSSVDCSSAPAADRRHAGAMLGAGAAAAGGSVTLNPRGGQGNRSMGGSCWAAPTTVAS